MWNSFLDRIPAFSHIPGYDLKVYTDELRNWLTQHQPSQSGDYYEVEFCLAFSLIKLYGITKETNSLEEATRITWQAYRRAMINKYVPNYVAGGKAGIIILLIYLHSNGQRDAFTKIRNLVTDILENSRLNSKGGMYWSSVGLVQAPLIDFSYGAAGIAVVLALTGKCYGLPFLIAVAKAAASYVRAEKQDGEHSDRRVFIDDTESFRAGMRGNLPPIKNLNRSSGFCTEEALDLVETLFHKGDIDISSFRLPLPDHLVQSVNENPDHGQCRRALYKGICYFTHITLEEFLPDEYQHFLNRNCSNPVEEDLLAIETFVDTLDSSVPQAEEACNLDKEIRLMAEVNTDTAALFIQEHKDYLNAYEYFTSSEEEFYELYMALSDKVKILPSQWNWMPEGPAGDRMKQWREAVSKGPEEQYMLLVPHSGSGILVESLELIGIILQGFNHVSRVENVIDGVLQYIMNLPDEYRKGLMLLFDAETVPQLEEKVRERCIFFIKQFLTRGILRVE
jgi:hypothetical protein